MYGNQHLFLQNRFTLSALTDFMVKIAVVDGVVVLSVGSFARINKSLRFFILSTGDSVV